MTVNKLETKASDYFSSSEVFPIDNRFKSIGEVDEKCEKGDFYGHNNNM